MVDRKTRVFRALPPCGRLLATFCGVAHKNVTSYVSEDIEMIPNIPKEWMKNYQKNRIVK